MISCRGLRRARAGNPPALARALYLAVEHSIRGFALMVIFKMILKRGSFVGLLVALLVACAAPGDSFVAGRDGVIGRSNRSGQLVLSAASDGLVSVVIRGDAFSGRLANPNALIADFLRLPPGFPPARFVVASEAASGRGERLVLVFDADISNLDVHRLCRDLDAVVFGTPGARLTLSAAFCIGQKMTHGAVGAAQRPQAMNDEFKSFLNRVLREVFPFHTLNRL